MELLFLCRRVAKQEANPDGLWSAFRGCPAKRPCAQSRQSLFGSPTTSQGTDKPRFSFRGWQEGFQTGMSVFKRAARSCTTYNSRPTIRTSSEISEINYADFGRVMPSLIIRDSNVVGFRPKIRAAPAAPRIRQRVDSRTCRMWVRSTSSSI